MIQFIHIPKNAGTTASKMLGRNGIDFRVGAPSGPHTRHWYARQVSRLDLENSFAIVRNPYTRTVSWYEWIRRLPKYRSWTFEQFVTERLSRGRARHAWTPQTEWTHDQYHRVQLVTHILHYENLREELSRLFPQISGKWLHLNSGGIEDYDAYYTAQTRQIVRESFSVDFINFGYSDK